MKSQLAEKESPTQAAIIAAAAFLDANTKYTIIYQNSWGNPVMLRIETIDIMGYIKSSNLDARLVFEGWPEEIYSSNDATRTH